MRIRRSRMTGGFLQVPNATVRDDRLSHMARGILVELLSRPDGWEASADEMWRASLGKHGKGSPGRRAFRACFAELKQLGYLTAVREPLTRGRHATVLVLTDVPHGGTSAPPAETGEPAGPADVPACGTSAGGSDVPHGGTSDSPAETDVPAGRTDVPFSDVPPCGTSKKENGEKNTGWNTLPSASADADQSHPFGAAPLFDGNGNELPADAPPQKPEDLTAFGAFWLVYPKRKDKQDAIKAWRAALARGADPQQITEAATAYARERTGQNPRYTKYPATWLNKGCYEDEPDPQPARPLRAVSGDDYQPFQVPDASAFHDQEGF